MAHKRLIGLGLLGALVLVGCSTGDTSSPSSPSSDDGTQAEGVHWGYSGDDGPENWGSLSPEFATCETGTEQSPIAIENPKAVKRPAPELDYRAGKSEVVNNGHTVMALPGPGQEMTVDGKSFDLVQMHFHTPAENTVDGEQHAGEAHFVHESQGGEIAVFGVLLDEGAETPAWQPYIDGAAASVEGATSIDRIDWSGMLPKSKKSVRFAGSLTTPECTEGLAWFVATEPVTLSAEQLSALNGIFGDNARPVQPLNGRTVTVDK